MVSPLSFSPDNTPVVVYEVSSALAWYVFPALFILVSVLMMFARVSRPPYFAYFCAFGALGSMSLCLASGNNPFSALALLIAFPICPLLTVRNLLVLHSRPERSVFHLGAKWISFFSLGVISFLILGAVFDLCTSKD